MKVREAATAIIAAVIAVYWVSKDLFNEKECLYTKTNEENETMSIWEECSNPPKWWEEEKPEEA